MEANTFVIEAANVKTMEKSARLIQYITLYNLKEDQLFLMCPLVKSSLSSPQQFDLELECLYEMGDATILYQKERKERLRNIRDQEEKQRKQQQARLRQKSKSLGLGFIGKLFGSGNKEKKTTLTQSQLKRRSIYEEPMKSSAYVKPQQIGENVLLMMNSQKKVTEKQEKQQQQQQIDELWKTLVNNKQQEGNKVEKPIQSKIAVQVEESLVTYRSSCEKDKINLDAISEHSREQMQSVNENKMKKTQSDILKQQQGLHQKYYSSVQPNQSLILNNQEDRLKEQQNIRQQQSVKELTDRNRDIGSENRIRQSEIQSLQYSLLGDEDVESAYRSTFKEQLNWMMRVEAIDRQQQLLVDRIRHRWNKPSKTIESIRQIKFSDISKDVISDPRYSFQRTKFNYGQIID